MSVHTHLVTTIIVFSVQVICAAHSVNSRYYADSISTFSCIVYYSRIYKCRPPAGLFSKAASSEHMYQHPKRYRYLFSVSISGFVCFYSVATELPILRYQGELLSLQLMRTNYVPGHSRDHDDTEYVSRGVDRKTAEFIGDKHIHLLINIQTLN